MLKHQAEIHTREMLLDAEWIAWGRYYLRRGGPDVENKYWDEHGNDITVEQSVERGTDLALLTRGWNDGKASKDAGGKHKDGKGEGHPSGPYRDGHANRSKVERRAQVLRAVRDKSE